MGVSEGMGFPKSRIWKFGGELSPNEAPSLDWALHTQGVSEGIGFPIIYKPGHFFVEIHKPGHFS